MESKSIFLREQGNKIFRSLNFTVNYAYYAMKMKEAIYYYQESLAYSDEFLSEDYTKARKNIVLAYSKIFTRAKEEFSIYSIELKDLQEIFSHLLENYLTYIKHISQKTPNYELIEHFKILQENLETYLDKTNLFQEISYEDLFKTWNVINYRIPWDFFNLKIVIIYMLGKKYFRQGMEYMDSYSQSYIKAKSSFNNSLEMVKEALFNFRYFQQKKNSCCKIQKDENYFYFKKSIPIIEIIKELANLEEQNNFNIFRCTVFHLLEKGDKKFSIAINEDESIDMDLIRDTLDLYREAHQIVTLLKEGIKPDIELEAIVCSKLGYILCKVFKLYEKSRVLLKMAIDLGMSLYPKNVGTEIWYIKASNCLSDIRLKMQNAEEEAKLKQKEGYLKQLNETIIEIEKKRFSASSIDNFKSLESLKTFLKYLLEKHKPETIPENYNIDEELNIDSNKKLLLKLIKLYHPDKNYAQDMKMNILMEEITKILNDIYSNFK